MSEKPEEKPKQKSIHEVSTVIWPQGHASAMKQSLEQLLREKEQKDKEAAEKGESLHES